MAVITLTTDWGTDGAYTGAFRGLLYSLAPEVPVIDICNGIRPFDIGQAAFVLSQAFMYYPQGSVHIMGVCPVSNNKSMLRYLAISCAGHFFIGSNTGVWELLMGETEFDLHEIAIQPKQYAGTGFPELEIFGRAATAIIKRGAIDFLGKKLPSSALLRQMPMLPKLTENEIRGHVVFFDHYGNAITNITRQDMEQVGRGRPFEILVSSVVQKVSYISTDYEQNRAGQLMAIYSFSGYIEIAMVNSDVRSVLNLSINSEIAVKFAAGSVQGTLF